SDSFYLFRRPSLSTLFPYTTLFRSYVEPIVGCGLAAAPFLQEVTDGRAAAGARRAHDEDVIAFALQSHAEFERLGGPGLANDRRSEEHTSELQSRENLVCRLLLEKK